VWTLDYRPDYSAAESGLDAFVCWERDFVGREAALREREQGQKRKLVTLVVQADSIDVSGDEAILLGEQAIGHVTSGGYAHHAGRSVALGYVPHGLSQVSTELSIEINGLRYSSQVLGEPLYDPAGARMRA
jgi:dimethylglycine dehydrogenase